MKPSNFEQLFKDSFSEFEADVPARAWENIQQGLSAQGTTSHGTEGGQVGSSGFSKGIIGIVSLAVVGVASWFYFSTPENESAPDNKAVQVQEINETVTSAPVEKLPAAQLSSESKSTKNSIDKIQVKGENQIFSNSHENFSANDNIEPLPPQENTLVATIETEKQDAILRPAILDENVSSDSKTSDNVQIDDEENTAGDAFNSSVDATTGEKDASSSYEINYPNIITPNGDNKNEVFIIETKNIKTLKVIVRDLSMKEIHSWNTIHGFWDGRLANGSWAEPGKYLIDIFATTNQGEPVPQKATLELIR